MKYCRECGYKNEAINGIPPKFCSNCGEPLSAISKTTASSKPEVESEIRDIPEISLEDAFEISETNDFSSFKFGDIAKGETKEYVAPRAGKSLKQIQDRLKQKQYDIK